jgi:hypothetical protein
MKPTPNVRLVPQSDDSGSTARNEGLRHENLRLKTLVVQLSAIIAKNAAAQKWAVIGIQERHNRF